MDKQKLVHFLAVAEEGHFGRAAARLGVSQQAVSKSIARLEASLDIKLFHRGLHGANLTDYGRIFASRARQIVAELDLVAAEIDAVKGGRNGHVRLGIGMSFATKVVPLAVRRFRRLRPGNRVTGIVGSSGQLYRMLANGEIDFAVSAPADWMEASGDIHRERLFEEHDVPVVCRRHPLASRPSVSLADLAQYPWIVPAHVPHILERTCAQFTAAGLAPPRDIFQTDSITLGNALLHADDYVVLSLIANLHPGSPDLVELRCPWVSATRVAYFATRKRSRLSPAAQLLADLVCEESLAYARGVVDLDESVVGSRAVALGE